MSKYCPYCGHPLLDNETRCPVCGNGRDDENKPFVPAKVDGLDEASRNKYVSEIERLRKWRSRFLVFGFINIALAVAFLIIASIVDEGVRNTFSGVASLFIQAAIANFVVRSACFGRMIENRENALKGR